MDIRKLQRAIVDGLEDVKAQNIAVFNTEHLSPLFERVIIASGTSNRQTKALASSVRDTVKARGMQVMRTEGEDNGEWIIVDCGAAVAHIMQPAIRDYYHLEEIWGGKAVRMKLGSAEVRLPKAEEPAPASGTRRPVANAAATRPAARKASVKTSAAKKPAAQKPAAKKPAAKASGGRPTAKKPAAAKTTARKAPARAAKPVKPAAPARQAVPAKKPAARHPVAKAPARAPAARRGAPRKA